MAVKNTFVAGTDILASTMNANFATLPWAMEVAEGSIILGTGTIVLTNGRFHSTTAPAVMATVLSPTVATSVTIGTPTYSAGIWTVPVYVWAGSALTTATRVVRILAIQQSASTSLG
jgi:hypothetical protein